MDKTINGTIKLLVEIGNDAANGLICRHCGRAFKKSIGRARACKRCQAGE